MAQKAMGTREVPMLSLVRGDTRQGRIYLRSLSIAAWPLDVTLGSSLNAGIHSSLDSGKEQYSLDRCSLVFPCS